MLDSLEYTVLRTLKCKTILGHFESTISLIAPTVGGGRVSLMNSLLFHIILFARDHRKYLRNAQNNAMRPCAYSAYVILGFGNVFKVAQA